MVKIVCISDTHNQLSSIKIPDGDVLIHAGDFTSMGSEKEIEKFNHDLGNLPHKTKICIPGNHDFLFEENEDLARSLLSNATHLLIDEEIIINGIKFYGSPYQVWFHSWAFNLPRGAPMKEKWDKIPKDTDVLITHGPPYKILDAVPRPWLNDVENVGDRELNKAIKRVQPKYNIFGHIHESYGYTKIGNTIYINASCLDENYRPGNKPIIFNIEGSSEKLNAGSSKL